MSNLVRVNGIKLHILNNLLCKYAKISSPPLRDFISRYVFCLTIFNYYFE